MNFNELWGFCDRTYGTAVIEDGSEFIICPECGESIYECDYWCNNHCPCCEFDFEEDM